MDELFSNLIDNAIKYRRNDVLPVINITSALLKNYQPDDEIDPKDFWKISVQDNGIGFDPVYNQKIFELFRRLQGKHDYSGTGIGLAICKKIVQNHGGYITAQGVKDGGAVFHIFVPQTN
jgi:signal transduction histidine kinase